MAQKKYTSDVVHFTASADTLSGALIELGVGLVGIVVNDVVSGDMRAAEPYVQVLINNSGVAYTAGDTVGYDASADEAVAAAGGDFDVGKAVNDAGTSEAVLVMLNV